MTLEYTIFFCGNCGVTVAPLLMTTSTLDEAIDELSVPKFINQCQYIDFINF